MMDLSDGLVTDLPRLCARSRVGAVVDPSLLPVPPSLAAEPDLRQWQLAAGDDYELLFTAPPANRAAIEHLAARLGRRATRIGTITASVAVVLTDGPWPRRGFDHFQVDA
jgi:thiamine-monophosphate kinase